MSRGARATKARFAKWEKHARAGAIATLIKAESAYLAAGTTTYEEMAKEVECLLLEAREHGVLEIVEQIVNDVPRLPPERSAADKNYNALDRLHRRLQEILKETARARIKETGTARQLLAWQERDIAQESTALAAVLDEGRAAAKREIDDMIEDQEARVRDAESREADHGDAQFEAAEAAR